MEDALVSVEEVQAKLSYEMSPEDERECERSIEEMSDEARRIGSRRWGTPGVTPGSIKRLIVRSVARHMKNYDGFTVSRAGDETLGWADLGEDAGSAYFTDKEERAIRGVAGYNTTGFTSVQLSFDQPVRRDAAGYVPVSSGGANFPLFPSEDGPW